MYRSATMKIAIVGAESTGKTQLALQMTAHFQSNGQTTRMVSEFLREWCEREQRTPLASEQRAIAQEQARRIDAAHDVAQTIADTTPLMTAIYSDLLFDDSSLYDFALQHQRRYDLTLLTALDLPWVADGLQRDGPHVRPEVDRLVRQALDRAGISYQVVHGQGQQRLARALTIVEHARRLSADPRPAGHSEWTWHCSQCGNAHCEHRLFKDLLNADSVRH